MQSAELYSQPLRVLDVEARLGAPPLLQTALWSAGSPRLRYFRADSGWQKSPASPAAADRRPTRNPNGREHPKSQGRGTTPARSRHHSGILNQNRSSPGSAGEAAKV